MAPATIELCVSDANRVFMHTHTPPDVRRVWSALAYWYADPDGSRLDLGRLTVRGVTVGAALDALRGLDDGLWIRVFRAGGDSLYQIGMPSTAISYALRGEQLDQADISTIGRLFPYRGRSAGLFVPVRPDPIPSAA